MSQAITIIGIDAATQPKKLGLARGRFDGGEAAVHEVTLGSELESVVETLVSWVCGPTLLAIDAPLGWPSALAAGLHGHRAGAPLIGDATSLFRRVTDQLVHARLGKLPLEVGADRIARTAHATLGLIDTLRTELRRSIPLAWSRRVRGVAAIEVYPAATLRTYDLDAKGYKGATDGAPAKRRDLTRALSKHLALGDTAPTLRASDDCLDAAVCILAAADFLAGRCLAPTAKQRAAARTEGWIWFRDRPHPPR
ncbi:MAG: DUF429 domain-containing protein [Myxococcota bacterium]